MSHDRGWRAACIVTLLILKFHSRIHEVARGVTAMVVGSGALLAAWFFVTTNPVPITSRRFAGSTSATFIRGFLLPTKPRILPSRTFFSETHTHARDPQIDGLSQHAHRSNFPVSCASRPLDLANVKDEPRRDLARGVPFLTRSFRKPFLHDS